VTDRSAGRQELSDSVLERLKPPPSGRIELRDARVVGLTLRMTKTGAATWSIRARTHDGKQTRPALGTWPAMSVSKARKAALAALVNVQAGGGPVAAKRSARAERRAKLAAAVTVADRLREWQAMRIADPKAAWSVRYAAEVKRIAERDIVRKLGRRDLAETTRAEWAAIIADKRKSAAPAMAASLYRTCAAFLGFAEAHGWIATPLLPRKGGATLAPPPQPRARVLTDAELVAIWKSADREAPKLRAFVRLLMLTAAREREVSDMAAGEIDRDAGLWQIPSTRTKNRTAYTVPLSPLALAELATVWPNEEPTAPQLLLGRSPRAGFRGFSRLKARLDAASDVTGWRFHDLRRTARTGMARLGVPRDHAEAAVNHISARSRLERTYDRHDYAAEIVGALVIWQAHVAGLVGAAAELHTFLPKRARAGQTSS